MVYHISSTVWYSIYHLQKENAISSTAKTICMFLFFIYIMRLSNIYNTYWKPNREDLPRAVIRSIPLVLAGHNYALSPFPTSEFGPLPVHVNIYIIVLYM